MPIIITSISSRKIILYTLALFLIIIVLSVVVGKPIIRPSTAVLPLNGKVIAIDPGHGGYDPGVFRQDIIEKVIVLEVALELRDLLQQGGAEVIMTRETDRDHLRSPSPTGAKKEEDLRNRLEMVKDADMFISIHINAFGNSTPWKGAQTFYHTLDPDGKRLADLIQEELKHATDTQRTSTSLDTLYLLKNLDMPSCLVELGFVSNNTESRLLQNPDYQRRLAWSIYLGAVRYYTD